MHQSHPVTTPLDIDKCLSKINSFNKVEDFKACKIPYQKAVGSRLYAAQATHPDIGYGVNLFCQFCNNPQNIHWNAVK